MFDFGTAAAYDLSGSNGELLLMLLIAFALGALFGRTLLAKANSHHKSSAASLLLPPATNNLPAVSADDDLKKIPGIGPQVAEILYKKDIRTFAQLAQITPDRLQRILKETETSATGLRTWPTMAAFLAAKKITSS